jgi:hypothetical protein
MYLRGIAINNSTRKDIPSKMLIHLKIFTCESNDMTVHLRVQIYFKRPGLRIGTSRNLLE